MTPEELDALMALVDKRIQEGARQSTRVATVTAVNADGSVNLDMGGAVVPSQPALTGYSPRRVGDVVVVATRTGEMLTLGKSGPPVEVAAFRPTVADSDPPAGQGWRSVTSGVWVRNDGAVWCRPAAAAPPVTGGSVERSATELKTYRGGSVIIADQAGQGDWAGSGLRTGLATFGPGAWAALAGKSPTGGSVTFHRSGEAHGANGATPVRITITDAATPPASTPAAGPAGEVVGYAELNGTVTVGLSQAMAARFATTNAAIRLYSTSASDYVLIDAVKVKITY